MRDRVRWADGARVTDGAGNGREQERLDFFNQEPKRVAYVWRTAVRGWWWVMHAVLPGSRVPGRRITENRGPVDTREQAIADATDAAKVIHEMPRPKRLVGITLPLPRKPR